MRTDEELSRQSFRFSQEWKRSRDGAPLTPEIDRRLQGGFLEDGRYVVHSLSGNERNHLFMNREGQSFDEMSALSGLDNPADGRGFALLDYNRDGKQDIALVNANTPAFNLYRNDVPNSGKVIAVQFAGGNVSAKPAAGLTNRDGYGALVTIEIGGMTVKREHRCGEGYATQNSATMLIGIGDRDKVEKLTVKWPSGKSTSLTEVKAGSLVRAFETGENAFDVLSYGPAIPPRELEPLARKRLPLAEVDAQASPNGKLRVYLTMTTWCEACYKHLPEINALRRVLEADGVEVIAVPVDVDDDEEKLAAYMSDWEPAYRMMSHLSAAQRLDVTSLLAAMMGTKDPPLPSSIITDNDGFILSVSDGVPSLSHVRRLLGESTAP